MTHIEAMKQARSVISSINAGKNNALRKNNETVFWQREEWVRWALDEVLPVLNQAIAKAEKESALQALHNENERLGLYKDAYAEKEPVAWKETHGKVIKALAGIVNVHTPDKLFDLDAIPRESVMGLVQQIKVAIDAYQPQRSDQEPVAHLWQHGETGRTRVTFPDSVTDCDASWFCVGPLVLGNTHPPQRTKVVFPTMLRKMWSGGEVQAWLDENVNKENT